MHPTLKIIVVEDHDVLRSATVAWLSDQGHVVTGADSAEALEELHLAGARAQVYVIDLNLPGEDGLSLARRLRREDPLVGIVMTTARSKIGDRVEGYKNGADIYLPKPVEPEELLAAIEALGLRLGAKPPDTLSAIVLDVEKCVLHGPCGTSQLTYAETTLLSALVHLQEELMPRVQIAALLGITNSLNFEALLNVRLSQLRKKFHLAGIDGLVLQSIRGRGYRLNIKLQLL